MSFNSSSTKFKSDVDQLDDLVKDLLIEVNRPIGGGTGGNHHQRNSTSTSLTTNNNNNTNNNNKYSTSSSSYSYQRRSNNEQNNDSFNTKLPSAIRASSYTQASTLNNQKRNDFDANTVSGLIDGSNNGIQREEQRVKSTREERIRIKRGGGSATSAGTDIPITTSSSVTTTTTTTNKPAPTNTTSSRDQLSIDEQLIDSLLESVQNTLKKRSQQQRSNQSQWSTAVTTDIPVHQGPSRRTYSSSAAYTDSIHRMDPNRGRFPIKLQRTDSPTSTLSSRRPYSRQDNREGYATQSASTTAIPNHFRATSEPPPDGPIELRRMDLVRSPSRSYFDGPPPQEYYQYSRSTLPASGVRVRGQDYSGYETDTGLVTSRGYSGGQRYYGGPSFGHVQPGPPPPPPGPMHHTSYYPQAQPMHFVRERHHEAYSGGGGSGAQGASHPRSMLRPDGYDTDTGLISSGRLRMTRTLPPRMAAIPETLVLNNRMVSQSNLNSVPSNLRGSSFLNENISNTMRQRPADHLGGYETDSGMHIRQQSYARRPVPIDVQYGDSGWVGKQPMSRPTSQQQRVMESSQQRYRSQDQLRSTSIPVFTSETTRLPDQHITMANRTHQQRVPLVNQERLENSSTSTKTPATPTFPVSAQSYHQTVQTRLTNNSTRTQDETSRRSSVSSVAESDVQRHGAYQAHNVSQFWYKEKMSREDAINLLKTKAPGTFLVRDSQGFPGSYGLAVKVETLPPGIQPKPGADPNAELVRHYLIERTPTGHVRLKGCPNEPDFVNLSALVYQHSITPLALPIRLILPVADITEDSRIQSTVQESNKKMSVKDLLEKGAACNVLYLNNVDVESLPGHLAVSKALAATFDNADRLQATIVHFKVSNAGITLTDTKKKTFSRRHFPKEHVTYCGLDYENERFWTYQYADLDMLPRAKCFGFVSKKINGTSKSGQSENECHIFAEIDRTQPASAIVNFVSKVMIGSVPV